MRYRVEWSPKSLQQLAPVWTSALDRAAVNAAVDAIDTTLANDPDTKGEDYFGDRGLNTAVMWVLFRVYDDQSVEVLEVGRPGIDWPHDEIDSAD